MKKIVLLLAIAFCCKVIFPQEGSILYTDFSPDTSMVFWAGNVLPDYNPDLFYVDFDSDGVNDFYFWGNWGRFSMAVLLDQVDLWESGWQITPCEKGEAIASIPDNCWGFTYTYRYPEHINRLRTNALRRKVGENYYYGWFEASVTWDDDDPTRATATLYKMAYCTIPNYPLCYGQTSLTDTVEFDVELFAVVRPNPTSGAIIVTCIKPHQVELINIQGHRITTQQSVDFSSIIDLSKQPAGVYFVSVTDQEGRRCVKKVIKQ